MVLKAFCFLKLFNSIKDETEAAELARLEIESLIGSPKPVHNVFDVLSQPPLAYFTDDNIRVQDSVTHELPYGEIQGYSLWTDRFDKLELLVKRLGYTREIFVCIDEVAPQDFLREFFPLCELGRNVHVHQVNGHTLFRLVTHQYFLEKSEFISKLSRNEREVDRNVDILFSYPVDSLHRVPATESMRVGKRLEDYFASRRECSLYLTHYMHPYKGKFHPKMARAIINYIYPATAGVVLDNFAGSGTSLVEAMFLGLDAKGVEINPLSALMTEVKCRCLKVPLRELKEATEKYVSMAEEQLQTIGGSGVRQLRFAESRRRQLIESDKASIPPRVLNGLKNKDTLDHILLGKALLSEVDNDDARNFLLLALSGVISDIYRRTTGSDFLEALKIRLKDLYLRVYLFHRLNETLKIELGTGVSYVGDTRDMKELITNDEVDAIVNSPPYSTALDYIKNDEPQLHILRLASVPDLQTCMVGHPKLNYRNGKLVDEMISDVAEIKHFSTYGYKLLGMLSDGRREAAVRTYRFWADMVATTKEMYRVLKPGAKCAVVIGNNHYLVDSKSVEVQNDRAFQEIAEKTGFHADRLIKRSLEKTTSGEIRTESIVIVTKPIKGPPSGLLPNSG